MGSVTAVSNEKETGKHSRCCTAGGGGWGRRAEAVERLNVLSNRGARNN